MIVVDTNVVAYLVLPGSHTTLMEAVRARDGVWAAPPLIRHELYNVMVKQVRYTDASAEHVLEAFTRAMTQLRIASQPSFGEVLALAEVTGCTSYDCEFVAVARQMELKLITSDRQVLAAFPEIAVSPEIFVA